MLRAVKSGSAKFKSVNNLRYGFQKRFLASDSEVVSSADVVIVGGGIAGCNTLYQLTKRGVSAVLLERGKLTSGTTWHTAGFVWSLRPSDLEVKLLEDSRTLYETLGEESEDYAGWNNNGGLFISRSKLRTQEYMRLHTLGNAMGVPSEVLSPADAQKIFPLLDPSVFEMALYCKQDGTVEPDSVCNTLVKASTKRGAKVYEDTPVLDIHYSHNMLGNKEVTGVHTNKGFIRTKCVVNCGGAWGGRIARFAGIPALPLIPFKHAYVVMDRIPEVRGGPNIRDHDASLYLKVAGETVSVGGYEPNPIMLDQVSDSQQFHLYDLDWDVFGMHSTNAAILCPALAKVGVKSTVCGPESFTPDHKPLLGEDPNIFGLYHNCGYNSAGIMFSAGCGIQLAEWIVSGRPHYNMFTFDIRRFTAAQTSRPHWVRESSHEAYAKNYSLVFPHDEPLAGRDVSHDALHQELVEDGACMQSRAGWERPGLFLPGEKRQELLLVFPHDEPLAGRDVSHDALHQELVEDGACMQSRAGWERPGLFLPGEKTRVQQYDWGGTHDYPRNLDRRYEDMLKGDYTYGFSKYHDIIRQEALACRNGAALFNQSYYGKLYLTGPDAQRVAALAFTADLTNKADTVVYTLMLNEKGGVEADVTVSVLDGGGGQLHEPIFKGRGYYVVTAGFSANHTMAHLRRIIHSHGLRATITDVSKQLCVLSVQGPDSQRILQRYTDTGLSNDAFPLYAHKSIRVSKAPNSSDTKTYTCRALRVTWSGELGWELHVPSASAVSVYKALRLAKNLNNSGWRALTALSAEKGYHLWNADLRSDDNPVEAGLGFTCRKDGDYVGNEAVTRARVEGVAKKYAFFTMDDQVCLLGQEAVYRNGEPVGYLRRGDYAYYLDKPIGIGYVTNKNGVVTNKYLNEGDYEIDVMGKRYKATLHLKSPFDPKGQRLLGNYGDRGMDENTHEPHAGQNERAGGSE